MHIRAIRSGTGLKSQNGFPGPPRSGVSLGAAAILILAGIAWLPTAGVTRPQNPLTPAVYSIPHKNAAQTEETPATIKRAPAGVRTGSATTIRVDFSPAGPFPNQKPAPGKTS